MTSVTRDRLLAYGPMFLLGLTAALTLLSPGTLSGAGGVWRYPEGDLGGSMLAHLAFQAPGWHIPPLVSPLLGWPDGQSISMLDGNPLISLPAKLLASVLGHAINLLGIWIAACLVLQPVASAYLVRGFTRPPEATSPATAVAAAWAAGALALMLPAFLYRIHLSHINLIAHFLLMLAAGLAIRHSRVGTVPGLPAVMALLLTAVLVHPYLFIFSTALLISPSVTLLLRHRPGGREGLRNTLAAAQVTVVIFLLLNGFPSVGGPGYGIYSLNLLAPVWPQYSGIFGANLPELDATRGQFEGFNYLGTGVIVLLAAGAAAAMRANAATRAAILRGQTGLWLAVAGLLALAVTPRITIGPHLTLALPMLATDRLFAVVRASGRAFWPITYVLIAASLAVLARRLPRRAFIAFACVCIALQFLDTAPLRALAAHDLSDADEAPPDISFREKPRLYRTVPACGAEPGVFDTYRLAAFRAGAKLADTHLTYALPDADCAALAEQGLTDPLIPGEARLFKPTLMARVDPVHLRAACRGVALGLLCERVLR